MSNADIPCLLPTVFKELLYSKIHSRKTLVFCSSHRLAMPLLAVEAGKAKSILTNDFRCPKAF